MADSQEQHEIISKLKNLALELGRSPRLSDLIGIDGLSKHHIVRAFGGFTVAMQAAGLQMAAEANKKKPLTNEIFKVDIERHLDQYEPRAIPEKTEPWPKIAVLGDLHEPFGHDGVKAAFIEFCREHQPEYIVQVGDAFDHYSHSKFPRSHNLFTPKEEEQLARKRLEELWAALTLACPKAKLIMLCGNHDLRPLKRTVEGTPFMEHWAERYFLELMTFHGVEFVADHRDEYLISGIAFNHGHRAQLGQHRDYIMRNFVGGHTHRGGAVFRSFRDMTLWELNAGFAADPNAKGLTYTSTKTTGWTLGWGWIDRYGPRFIPFGA